ncbi:MAG: ArsJ-associated glyceraldehyde-3-phosphate dehydrogenase [Phycisphaerales bacterium JB063]
MATRIGINGFGRMGRLGLRAAWGNPALDIAHINEVQGGPPTAAHLLKFDTVHGQWPHEVTHADNTINIDGSAISFSDHASPTDAPWADTGVEVVVECSGKFRTRAALQPYFDAGVKKVVVSAPVKDADLNIVIGCNDALYEPASHHLVTAASCTTNCLAPVVKVMHESLGIRHGAITTLHDVTNTQVVVDAPHKDLRRARSALNSLIPTSTGSATAIGMIYPELQGRLNGVAVRVPLLNASLTDAVFEVERATTAEEVNAFFEAAANTTPLKGILGYETRPLVSADYVNDTRSAIIDAESTMVVDGTLVKVLAWYDNEVGYAHRLMQLTHRVASSLTNEAK